MSTVPVKEQRAAKVFLEGVRKGIGLVEHVGRLKVEGWKVDEDEREESLALTRFTCYTYYACDTCGGLRGQYETESDY